MFSCEQWHRVDEKVDSYNTKQEYVDGIQNEPWNQDPSGTPYTGAN